MSVQQYLEVLFLHVRVRGTECSDEKINAIKVENRFTCLIVQTSSHLNIPLFNLEAVKRRQASGSELGPKCIGLTSNISWNSEYYG